jgi:CheY-like chemotaxis protein
VLTNAIKYTPSGGHVRVRVEVDADVVRLVVRDDGVGMDPALLERAFQLFVQGPQDASRSSAGLGVGLTVARHLVKLHDGTLTARSEGQGRGTEVTTELPRYKRPHADVPVPPRPAPTEGPVPPMRVLVVDDNEDAAGLLADLLRLQGHHVEAAHTGRHALACIDQLRPALVFLDIGLPDVNGYALARQLRDRPDRPRLVALTGYGQREDRARAEEAGFDDFLVKPASLDAITGCLRDASGGRRDTRLSP